MKAFFQYGEAARKERVAARCQWSVSIFTLSHGITKGSQRISRMKQAVSLSLISHT